MEWFEYIFAGPYKTRDRAEESMEDSFADGEIDRSQNPRIVPIKDHRKRIKGYAVVLTDYNLKNS